jgi:filamentous hemagglutinin family protein
MLSNPRLLQFLTINILLLLSGVMLPRLRDTRGNILLAQIVPDQTLDEESSKLSSLHNSNTSRNKLIEGGAQRRETLFHSFEEFNIGEGEEAYFANPNEIELIVSRVTGNNQSNLLGKLGVLGDADLFLINPNGILFGPKAFIDVGGSFLATTASSIIFGNNYSFKADAPEAVPLLTLGIPVGLQFGSSVGNITNQSIQYGENNLPTGLQVNPKETLALLGGKITFQGGFLTAPSSLIHLGSLSKDTKVYLQPTNIGWSFDYRDAQILQDISLTQGSQFLEGLGIVSTPSIVSSSGSANGEIQVNSRNFFLSGGSQVRGFTVEPNISGANIVVNASESVRVVGSSQPPIPNFSGLRTDAFVSESAGNIAISAKHLFVRNGGVISASSGSVEKSGEITASTENAGNLTINVSELVELEGDGSALLTDSEGFGDSGNLIINTEKLRVLDRASVSVDSSGLATAGNLEISSQSIELYNEGTITAKSNSGDGGNISINNQDTLLFRHNSEISTSAGLPDSGGGNGGNIVIDSDFIVANPKENSNIVASAFEGRGGNISLTAQAIFGLEVRDERTPLSDIVASSEFGVDGTIDINTLEFDPTRGLEDLPTNVIDPSGLIAQGCNAVSEGAIANRPSEFLVTGRGGLPAAPTDPLTNETTFADWVSRDRPNTPIAAQQISRQKSQTKTAPIVEAKGWKTNAAGEVVLTAQATPTPANSLQTAPSTCQP